ncbi:MAG TPA: oligosaccharide flippase family protein [Nitrososphaerales archaeon]|nr:oligosaccharide flippase family protein [Nitrososphaerales archaeon]
MHVARKSAQGSIVLFAGNLAATAVQTVASILVARLLGPDSYGSYSLALVIPSVFQLLTSFGANTAVTRFVAYHVSRNEDLEARRFAESAMLITLLSGLVLAGACFLTAGAFSAYVFHRAYLTQYVELAAAVVCGQALLNTAIAAAIGWNAMGQASLMNIVQALIKLLASPLLIVLGFGLLGAVAGQTASAVFGAAIAVALLYASEIRSSKLDWQGFTSDARQMMGYGLPVYSATILSGVGPYYLSIVLSAVATNVVIGYYQAAYNFTVAIALLSGAAGSALFPAFTSLHGGQGDVPMAFKMAVKYVGFVAIPVIYLLAATATQLMSLFYGDSYGAGSPFLVLLAIASIPTLLGFTVIPSLFNGIARTRLTLVMFGFGAAALFASAPALAINLSLGVDGVIYSLLLSNLVATLAGLYLFRLEFASMIDFRAAASTLVAGGISFVLCYLVPAFDSNLLVLVVKLAVFSLAYLTIAPLLRAVTYDDLNTVGEALGEMPVLKRPIRLLIAYEKFFAPRDKAMREVEK